MQVRILHTESLRIPGEGSSALGESGANNNPKGEADAKQVNIPVPASGVIGVTKTETIILELEQGASAAREWD